MTIDKIGLIFFFFLKSPGPTEASSISWLFPKLHLLLNQDIWLWREDQKLNEVDDDSL